MRVTPIDGFRPAARWRGSVFAGNVNHGAHPTDNDLPKLIGPFAKIERGEPLRPLQSRSRIAFLLRSSTAQPRTIG